MDALCSCRAGRLPHMSARGNRKGPMAACGPGGLGRAHARGCDSHLPAGRTHQTMANRRVHACCERRRAQSRAASATPMAGCTCVGIPPIGREAHLPRADVVASDASATGQAIRPRVPQAATRLAPRSRRVANGQVHDVCGRAPDGRWRRVRRSSAKAPRDSWAKHEAAEPSVRSPERGVHGFPIIRAKAPLGARSGVPRRSDAPRDRRRRVTSRLLGREVRMA